jgi:membrane protease YdiL (CAAX protease family)
VRKLDLESAVDRLMAVARGLGFVFLAYLLPATARDLVAAGIPGATVVDALIGGTPWVALPLIAASVALSVLFVRLYSRSGPEADRPLPLLRADRAWVREWAIGFLVGGGAATVAAGAMILGGGVRIDGLSPGLATAPLAGGALLVVLGLQAALEELGFRGPAQRELGRAVTAPVAAAFLAGSFAFVHAKNPAADARGIAGVFLAGFALAGLVRARGDLGMACGAHAGWNVFVGMVWGLPVSGFTLVPRLLEARPAGGPAWTGGDFGVEGSIPGVAVLALAAAAAWMLRQAPSAPGGDATTPPAPPGGPESSPKRPGGA